MPSSKGSPLSINDFSGGLADSGSPSVINANESPCLLNVQFTRYGSLRSRTYGNRLLGQDSSNQGKVLSIHEHCICDDCNFFDDDVLEGESAPAPANRVIKIKSVDKGDGTTDLYYTYPNIEGYPWVQFDNIDGVHPHDIVSYNCRIYYSNGIEDLRYACFRPDPTDEDPCNLAVETGYPTCESEYGDGQSCMLINNTDQFIGYVNGLPGTDLSGLEAEIAAQAPNPVCVAVTIPDPNSSDPTAVVEFQVNATEVSNGVIYYDSIKSGTPISGLFCESICDVRYDNGGGIEPENAVDITPTWCGDENIRLAEGIKGYILAVHDNRLFVSGDQTYPDRVYYSGESEQFSADRDISPHIGDFFNPGANRTGGDADTIQFENTCSEVTALIEQDGNLYAHRDSSEGPNIYALPYRGGNADPAFDGFVPQLVSTNTGVSWFRNVDVQNSLQHYLTTYFGIPEGKQFGIFPDNITPKSRDISDKIRGTMEHMDFTQGVVAYFDRKLFFAGKYYNECDDRSPQYDECGQLIEDVCIENDTLLVYDFDSGSYTLFRDFYVSDFFVSKNKLCYGSSIDGNVFTLENDLLQDNVGLQEKKLEGFWYGKRYNFNLAGIGKLLTQVYLEGYIAPGTELKFGLDLDCGNIKTVDINYEDVQGCTQTVDCNSISCQGCNGEYGSKRFQAYFTMPSQEPFQFVTLQPFFEYNDGFFQIDEMTLFIEKMADDDIDQLLTCGSINYTGNKCFE